jgi:hypothetical protein
MEPFAADLLLDSQRIAHLEATEAITIQPQRDGLVTLKGELAINRPLSTAASLAKLGPREIDLELSLPLEPVLGLRPRLLLPVWSWRGRAR